LLMEPSSSCQAPTTLLLIKTHSTSKRKVLCGKCHNSSHNISDCHCIECAVKRERMMCDVCLINTWEMDI
jgi:hypothetical protein